MKDVIYEVYSNEEANAVLDYLKTEGLHCNEGYYDCFNRWSKNGRLYIGVKKGAIDYNDTINLYKGIPLIKGFKMIPKLKVGDKLPRFQKSIPYRCRHWDSSFPDAKLNFTYGDYVILEIEKEFYRFDRESIGLDETNYITKIEEIDNQIMETQKNIPRTFAITGSKSLLKAMEEELVGVGYRMGNTQYRETSNFLGIDSISPKTKEAFKQLYYPASSFTVPRDVTFQLPQQWDECLAFCKEQLELWDVPKYKVGDWVYDIENAFGNIRERCLPISRIERGLIFCKDFSGESNLSIENFSKYYRLATKEEIEKAQKIEVGGHTMEVVNGKFKFGCQYITKEEVETLRKFVGSPLNFKMKVGDDEVNTELLNKILNRL